MDYSTLSILGRDKKLILLNKLRDRKAKGQVLLIDTYFQDTGPLRRELYQKHLEFFRKGAVFEERLALAANRTGKTETMGGYELVCHLTGIYPKWWEGRRFDKPVQAWAAGKTGQTVRDILQMKLLGPSNAIGTGLIKTDLIYSTTPRHGIPGAIEKVLVKHVSGGTSELGFKSFDQRRQSFEGTFKDIIWLDEECPLDIYSECLLRTANTTGIEGAKNGLMIVTFTPLLGMTELVMQFLPNGEMQEQTKGAKAVIMATWDDVPHLTADTKEKMLASIPPFQRDARTKGVPQLGSGAIYPVQETEITIDDFEIPDHWPRMYELDVGWNRTAVVWGAKNPEDGVVYLYSEHYQGHAEPIVHAQAIKARGSWIPGEIDPAANGRSQKDGNQLMQNYIDLGLDLQMANNVVEAGIYEVWMSLSSGKLRVFKSLRNWFGEYRLYRRDEKGHIVKSNDHLMDCTRYLINGKMERAIAKPGPPKKEALYVTQSEFGTEWMG